MYHDPFLARAVRDDPRPRSAVGHGVGLAGLAGMIAWMAAARYWQLDGPYAALVNLLACAVPMIGWSLLVDRVHRRPSTGIDWNSVRPWRGTLDISLTKLAGLWATWTGIAALYLTARFYWTGNWSFAMWCLLHAAPVLVAASAPYLLWIDRRLTEPRDGAWHLGAWLTGQQGWAADAIHGHLCAWGVKAFFLPFMLAIVAAGFGQFVRMPLAQAFADPVALSGWLIDFMFTLDVAFACVGYMLTMRPLDSHIRSANPHAAAWMAALICYPPFILMEAGGPLDYHPGTADWRYWLGGHPWALSVLGAVLVALTAIYAWSTMAFGLRFSNLTHRGVLTHGPYALSRHPAYLSKNLYWWLATMPVLSTASLVDGARATAILGLVSGVYYWRAKTEERHLGADPDYRTYSDWMARHGPVPRLFRIMFGKNAADPA